MALRIGFTVRTQLACEDDAIRSAASVASPVFLLEAVYCKPCSSTQLSEDSCASYSTSGDSIDLPVATSLIEFTGIIRSRGAPPRPLRKGTQVENAQLQVWTRRSFLHPIFSLQKKQKSTPATSILLCRRVCCVRLPVTTNPCGFRHMALKPDWLQYHEELARILRQC